MPISMNAACMPGQHPRHAALVDVADQAAPAGALEKHLLQHAVFDHRGARLVRARIDQNLSAHRSCRACGPAAARRPAQELRGFEQRQAHHAGIAAAQIGDEDGATALNGIAARLVARLSGVPIVAGLGGADRAKGDFAAAHAGEQAAARSRKATAVNTSCVRPDNCRSMRFGILLDPPACPGSRRRAPRRYLRREPGRRCAPRLRLASPRRPWPRQAARRRPPAPRPADRLVHVDAKHLKRNADLRQQFTPTRRGRGEVDEICGHAARIPT